MSDADLTPTRRSLVTRAGALALLASTMTTEAASHGDAALVALGKQLDAAWVNERAATPDHSLSDEAFGLIVDRTAAVVDEIEKLPATTIEGLVVKARACSWCRSGDPFEDDSFGEPTTDLRLASSILRDLVAIGGKPVLTS